MLPASLKGKKLLRCCTEIIPWTAEFATSVVRGRILRAMILEGEGAWFDEVVLNALRSALRKIRETEDVIDDDVFNVLSASRFASPPVHPTPTAPKSFSLFNVHKQYRFLS